MLEDRAKVYKLAGLFSDSEVDQKAVEQAVSSII
jgi:hypothetical protein